MHIKERGMLLLQPEAINLSTVECIKVSSSTFFDDMPDLSTVVSLRSGKVLDELVLIAIAKQMKPGDDSTLQDNDNTDNTS